MTGNIFYFPKSRAATNETRASEAETEQKRLVERVLAGDEAAFTELYRMFAPMVHGIALARVPRDEADDLVQTVFLTAYKNLRSLRDRDAVGAWLATIARNRANEFYRSRKPTEELTADLSCARSARNEAQKILDAILTLPETYKETLVLRLVEGMTGAEIAAQTGMTAASVRVNLHRGMQLLRGKLGIEE